MRTAWLALGLVACAMSARAAGIAVLAPVTIDADTQLRAAIRDKCQLDTHLQDDIVDGLKRFDPAATTTTRADSGMVLRVVITGAYGLAGGGFSGAKSLAVTAEYLRDGQVAYTAKVHRLSGRSAFRDTCSLLQVTSKGMGRWISKWAQNPKDVIEPGSDRAAPTPVEPAASDAED